MAEIDRISGGEAIVCERRGPAPDVGRAVHPLQPSAAVDQLRRPGLDGLRLPRRHRRADWPAPTSWSSPLWATADSRCRSRNWPPSPIKHLPVKIIVMNNGYLGMVRQWQELFYNNRLSSVQLDSVSPIPKSSPERTDSRAARSRTRATCEPRWKPRCRARSLPSKRARHAV